CCRRTARGCSGTAATARRRAPARAARAGTTRARPPARGSPPPPAPPAAPTPTPAPRRAATRRGGARTARTRAPPPRARRREPPGRGAHASAASRAARRDGAAAVDALAEPQFEHGQVPQAPAVARSGGVLVEEPPHLLRVEQAARARGAVGEHVARQLDQLLAQPAIERQAEPLLGARQDGRGQEIAHRPPEKLLAAE